MHITRIEALDLPPLYGVNFECNEQVNLFIGPNASGKSTILRSMKKLHLMALEESEAIEEHEDGSIFLANRFSMGLSGDWPRDTSGTIWGAMPLLYIPATRVNLPGMDIFGTSIRETPIDKWSITRPLFNSDSELFSGPHVKSLIDAMPGASKLNRRQRVQLSVALQIGYSCAKSICSEVIRGASPHTYVESESDSLGAEDILARHYNMGIVTSDDILGDGLYAGALSSGTQGTFLWISALALEMANHYGWTEGWERKPAILLIDEIENHLHPTWQRRVIPKLLEHFPGLQIFATTHSPFVVAGLKTGQVHLLKRDENGVVTASPNPEDVIGWTADEILRNMMGVEEPTDQLTVDRANRLRQFREKETLTPEEESELNELRRQVNEDLLSKGGPLEAQRERYADLMERFLLSRQSDLTQDGD